jgi:hypothetical protein
VKEGNTDTSPKTAETENKDIQGMFCENLASLQENRQHYFPDTSVVCYD